MVISYLLIHSQGRKRTLFLVQKLIFMVECLFNGKRKAKQWWDRFQSPGLLFNESNSFLTVLSLSLPSLRPRSCLFSLSQLQAMEKSVSAPEQPCFGRSGFRFPQEKGANEFLISNAVTHRLVYKEEICPQHQSFFWSCLKRKQQQLDFIGNLGSRHSITPGASCRLSLLEVMASLMPHVWISEGFRNDAAGGKQLNLFRLWILLIHKQTCQEVKLSDGWGE